MRVHLDTMIQRGIGNLRIPLYFCFERFVYEAMPMIEYPRIIPSGDCAIIVEFGNEISEDINARISSFSQILQGSMSDVLLQKGVIEAVPTFRSVLITYDPKVIRYGALCEKIKGLLSQVKVGDHKEKRVVEIPVCYGGEYGPDLEFVAQHAGITPQEVIDIHTSTDYLIYMLGFQPGFPYLGGLDEKLVTPRLESPRAQIPAGSVGIGGKQTGLYPVASPAGWQIIGTTPVKCYNLAKDPAIPYEAGDYIRFYAITEEEYKEIEAAEAANNYQFRIHG